MPCNHKLSIPDTIAVIKAAGFRGGDIQIAFGVVEAESGRCVDATHTNSDGSIDRGLFQVNSVHSQYDAQRLVTDPQYNANAAHDIRMSSGWGAWTTYKNGSYKNGLTPGGIIASDVANPGPHPNNPLAGSPLNTSLDFAKNIWNMVGYVFTGDFWHRALKIIAGGVAITIALIMAMKEFNITPPIPIPV